MIVLSSNVLFCNAGQNTLAVTYLAIASNLVCLELSKVRQRFNHLTILVCDISIASIYPMTIIFICNNIISYHRIGYMQSMFIKLVTNYDTIQY